MSLKVKNQYWDDIQIALGALQGDPKVNKKKLKTTTLLQNFAIDLTKDTVESRMFKSSYRTADAFLRFAYYQYIFLQKSIANNTTKITNYVH